MRAQFLALCVLAHVCPLAACSGESPDGSGSGGSGGFEPLGLEVRPALFTEQNQPLLILGDDDPASLWRATQGGHVLLIGAQVREARIDTLDIRTRLRHPETNAIQAEEARTIVVKPVADQPGLVQSDVRSRSQMSHLATCPNYDDRSIIEETWLLEVTLTELYESPPRTGSSTIRIVPSCDQEDPLAEARCRCECAAGYVLGKCN